uniref:NACHT and WD repeat domain containing 2 n=1 Tax=Oncorhynchus kisutch TaxID=8019 RepID=A0A8C7HTK1_ONCKI
MWPSRVGSRQPCPRESALRRAAISGNVLALPPHHVPTGRSVRVFICANPDDTEAERNALKEHVYPKLRDFCRENYGIEFQVVDLYWGMDPEEWDSPDLQRLRMKLLEDCLQTSAGPCFVHSKLPFSLHDVSVKPIRLVGDLHSEKATWPQG